MTTKWGLLRYYWVAAKIAIAVGILVVAFGFLHDALERAGHEAAALATIGGTAADISGASDVVLWVSAVRCPAWLAPYYCRFTNRMADQTRPIGRGGHESPS